jgi:hypothetical protein
MKRVAFDLDETLGVPLIEGGTITGFQLRTGCVELLTRLRQRFVLVLWSVSGRHYLDRCLSFGLGEFFAETYSWDELPARWKDIRQIHADWLIDDSPHHREIAEEQGIADRYILVPIYGSVEDGNDPYGWVRLIEDALGTED